MKPQEEMEVLSQNLNKEISVEIKNMFWGISTEKGTLKGISPYLIIHIKKSPASKCEIPFIGIDEGIIRVRDHKGNILYENNDLKFLKKKPEEFNYNNILHRKELFDHMNNVMRKKNLANMQ